MIADQNLDRTIGAWLDSETTSVPDDLLARSLARVGETRQRPSLLAAEGVAVPTRGARVTFVPMWALILLSLFAAVVIVAGASRLLPDLTAVVEPSPTPLAQTPATPEASATPLPTPTATPGPLGGRPILAHAYDRDVIGPVDVFLLDAATGQRTVLGTMPARTFAYESPTRFSFIRAAATNAVVIEGNGGLPQRFESLTPAGRATDFRYADDLKTTCCADGYLEFISISPRGDRIAGLHAGRFDVPIEVVVEDLDGSNLIHLPLPEGITGFGPQSWAPDGSAILGGGCRPCNLADSPAGRQTEDHAHLYIVPLDGSKWRELLDIDNGGAIAEFSPDGSTILAGVSYCAAGSFAPRCDPSEDTGSVGIVDVSTGLYTKLRDVDGLGWLRWSPDGSRFAYQARDGLFVMRPDGSDLVKVDVQPDLQFQWSPDGQWFLYQTGEYDLWIVPADGSGPPRQVGTNLGGAAW